VPDVIKRPSQRLICKLISLLAVHKSKQTEFNTIFVQPDAINLYTRQLTLSY